MQKCAMLDVMPEHHDTSETTGHGHRKYRKYIHIHTFPRPLLSLNISWPYSRAIATDFPDVR